MSDSELAIYYMRDNHTFRKLPLDIDGAIEAIKEEFKDGYTHGMLCGKSIESAGYIHAQGMHKWFEFEHKAKEWIANAILVNQQPAGQDKQT